MERTEITLGYNHSFDVAIARECGLEAAIVFNHILYWLRANKVKGQNFYEGKTWMYDSYGKMAEFLDYLSPSRIKNAIKSLVDVGLLVKKQMKKKMMDHTNWYSVFSENLLMSGSGRFNQSIGRIRPIERTSLSNLDRTNSSDRLYTHINTKENNSHIEEVAAAPGDEIFSSFDQSNQEDFSSFEQDGCEVEKFGSLDQTKPLDKTQHKLYYQINKLGVEKELNETKPADNCKINKQSQIVAIQKKKQRIPPKAVFKAP